VISGVQLSVSLTTAAYLKQALLFERSKPRSGGLLWKLMIKMVQSNVVVIKDDQCLEIFGINIQFDA
jgi:hypothetical protein